MYFIDAIDELEKILKFIQIMKESYAYYLLAICYYDQIIDEKKDLGPLVKAKINFEYIIIIQKAILL